MGYSADHPHIAHLERELDARGQYQAFQDKFAELKGASWIDERDAYGFCRDEMAQAWSYAAGQSAESSLPKHGKSRDSMFTLDITNFCKWCESFWIAAVTNALFSWWMRLASLLVITPR